MDALLSAASNIAAPTMESDERWQAVQRVLGSPAFVKAPRMRAMLAFLMIRKLSGMEASISEYAVGIEVFRRDARDYDTTTDPVVRVQMGRLRERLAQYYATAGDGAGLRIAIPSGTYVPELIPGPIKQPEQANRLRLAPLRLLSSESGSGEFISGLEEELAVQLFQRFGGHDRIPAPEHRLEVSIRLEHRRARASIRLVETGTGGIVCLQQCDCHGDVGIALQEELALEISNVVQNFMCSSGTSVPGRAGAAA